MKRVKVHGAGSIGNHLANAARRLGCSVVVCDIDEGALRRMKSEIYPQRYGSWDDGIDLYLSDAAPKGGFDLICVGTPPESHLPIALAALDEEPAALLIEKPLCAPSLDLAQAVWEGLSGSRTRGFVGYDHVVGRATRIAEEKLASGMIGEVQTIEVAFQENWDGIFRAHPWLAGPSDSYLGFWQRGGGACGEHSHGINLWQHFAHAAGAGRVVEVDAMIEYARDGEAHFDEVCQLHLRTESGLIGRVAQDVVTRPHRKRARIHGASGVIEWIAGYRPGADAVVVSVPGGEDDVTVVEKTRPDDFIAELTHIKEHLDPAGADSPIGVERGFDTMMVIAAAHRSEAEAARMRINYGQGYVTGAIEPAHALAMRAAEGRP